MMRVADRISDITRPVSARIRDWCEIERDLTPDELFSQSMRCMGCGIPFCHGVGCPLGNTIPEINASVRKNKWREAWEILSMTSSFPEFTSRVCPALCENACTKNIENEPVMIRQLEKAVVERAFKDGIVKINKHSETGRKVAVVGSGPAGLAMAQSLAESGHSVVVFEKNAKVGGLLRYGIPDFKLNKGVIDRRVDLLREAGVKFRCNTEVGKDVSACYLKKIFDAIVIAVGTPIARDLRAPGRDLKNIYFAVDYLSAQNRVVGGEYCTPISAAGKNVVVIGGGDTGNDCVGTALRQKAASVTQIDIVPMPPVDRAYATPWPDWPYQLKTSSSHKEGGSRLWNCLTKSFLGQDGRVSGVEIAQVNWDMSNDGKPVMFKETANSNKVLKADIALIAMGFIGVSPVGIADELGLSIGSKGTLQGAMERGIFTCGDTLTGQSLVVRAIANARSISSEVNNYLAREQM